ncbi:phosphomannomutase/phosphoglucomutase [Candidatus Microgenomates bacterium]|nr:phosphomannomutase/phosphoglucomutase [Candidatus Microgenomates bacterium]MBI2622148.1 phosphomannomutase/phosphoglucomutase [Candidatus Microgenomates bacterium]
MDINPTIFKSYDVRGIYPQDLNEQNIVPIIKAIYAYLKPATLVVGTDMRVSSPSLTKVALGTLVELGAKVIDVGVLSTPTFYFSVDHYGYDAGIQITASHNPKEWNGIKIVKKGPSGLIKIGKSTGLEEIKEMALKGKSLPLTGGGTVVKKNGILKDEVENSLKIAGNPQISKFKIVADAANAMGSQYLEALFKNIPVELIRMNFTLDGTFPVHQPDPLQKETLVDLQKKVISEKADFGLAPDGDGDRLFFIDERGKIVAPTIITSIVAKELLKKNPGERILIDIRYILTPKKIIEESGGKMVITKVGHAYITQAMNKTVGIFAGESSAHYYFRQTGNAESPMPVILIILKVLTETGKTLSQLAEEYRGSFESGEINFKVINGQEIIQEAKNKYRDGRIDTLDGVAVAYPNWRFLLRTSNTEPLLRLTVESYDQSVMEEKRDELTALIKSFTKL